MPSMITYASFFSFLIALVLTLIPLFSAMDQVSAAYSPGSWTLVTQLSRKLSEVLKSHLSETQSHHAYDPYQH